ncbi:hypothetical protein B296_00041319 [Ensete ventricosum]|uniref:Uncharacterized protein n=1 Tax=Ensete ventricosum TaxID=4639 RepID=A0A426Z2N2_ENSVE|nr:hypothetical protein B296_00041319 [Ensete ventricosum]
MYDEVASNNQLRENLDLLEEKRAEAHLRILAYKKAVAKLYNRKDKLATNRKDLYRIIDVIREETYSHRTFINFYSNMKPS